MALWLIRRSTSEGVESYDVMRDDVRMLGIDLPDNSSVTEYRMAALMLRANVIRRLEDPAPVFSVDASDLEAGAFVGMLNAA